MRECINDVIAIVSKNAHQPNRDITADTPLQALNLESLDVLNIIFDLESHFKVSIADEAATDLVTKNIGELATYISTLASAPGDKPLLQEKSA